MNRCTMNNRSTIFNCAMSVYLIWINVLIGINWDIKYITLTTQLGHIAMYIVVILLFICIFSEKKYPKKYFLLTICMLITSAIVYLKTDDNDLLYVVMFIFAARGLNFERIVKCFAVTQMVTIVIIILAFFGGYSQNVITYFSYGVGFSLGTYHANNLATIIMSCFFALSYTVFKNKIWTEIIVALIVSAFLWNVSLSRTNCLLILLLPLLHIQIILMKKTKSLFFLKSTKYIVGVLLVLTLGASIFYNYAGFILGHGTFSERFRFGWIALREYGVHLFGSKIHYLSTVDARLLNTENMVLDSAYMRILIGYGLIATIFLIATMTLLISRALKQKNYNFLIICILFAVSGITQATAMSIYNFTLLSLFTMRYGKNKIIVRSNKKNKLVLGEQKVL